MSRSRASQKSGLSPSITKGSNAIDLGKNSGVDMGKKSQPSLTSGGIGVTQEVTNVGGMSVSVGGNIDITPVDFGVNINPSEGTISVATEAEIPGGLLGISGGIEVDLNTGEVIGGSIGGEVGGFGINLSNSKNGGLGVEFTYQIGLIEFSLGFRFPPKDPKDPTTPKNPTDPTNINNLPPKKPETKWTPPGGINIESVQGCTLRIIWEEEIFRKDPYASGCKTWWQENPPATGQNEWGLQSSSCEEEIWDFQGLWAMYDTRTRQIFRRYYDYVVLSWFTQEILNNGLNYIYYYHIPSSFSYHYYREEAGADKNRVIVDARTVSEPSLMVFNCSTQKEPNIYTPPSNEENTPPPPFPNPPPRKRDKMDDCCRLNLKFLRAIYTGLGIAKFPGKLPATIIQEVPRKGEEPAEPPQVLIKDFVDLLDWQFRRDDERWGQWVVQIDVEDTDITKEGDQGKQIKFPNLAESIAEIEGQILSLTANVDGLVALQVKNLAESGMARQEAIKGYLAAKAIIKYMAFKSTEIDVPVPMTFTAGAETISELLKESEGHIKGTDYSEKETLRDVFLDLLQAAAIVRAVHWQKINTKSDTKSQLLKILKGSVDLASTIANPKKSTDGEGKEFDSVQNFEDFIDSVEDGFRNTTGISDIENPYGRTPDRRPRIREIGDNLSEAGGNN